MGCAGRRTVDGEVAQGGARSPLDLEVGVLEQEQDGLERVAVDFADISLGDFGKRQAGRALQIDVVRVYEGTQCVEGLAGEEVGLGALAWSVSRA